MNDKGKFLNFHKISEHKSPFSWALCLNISTTFVINSQKVVSMLKFAPQHQMVYIYNIKLSNPGTDGGHTQNAYG